MTETAQAVTAAVKENEQKKKKIVRRKARKSRTLCELGAGWATGGADTRRLLISNASENRVNETLDRYPELLKSSSIERGSWMLTYASIEHFITGRTVLAFLARDKALKWLDIINCKAGYKQLLASQMDSVDLKSDVVYAVIVEAKMIRMGIFTQNQYNQRQAIREAVPLKKRAVSSDVSREDAMRFIATDRVNRICCLEGCGKIETIEQAFPRCGRCGTVVYCSKDCQRAAWPTHKVGCVA